MSSSKTQRYHLHVWDPEDNFLRNEFNENFIRLDKAAKVTCGTFTGNGQSSRLIELGFRPKAVYMCNQYGQMLHSSSRLGGIAMEDAHSEGVELADQGFTVYNDGRYVFCNNNGDLYFYFAIY